MGMYKHIREAWKNPSAELSEVIKLRMVQWREDPVTIRIERPTRLDRARSLGYKAKPGIIIVRQRVRRGGHIRPYNSGHRRLGGRRPKTQRTTMLLEKRYQQVAEERANVHYPNCEVLNSYMVGKDGVHYWYEIILVDRESPSVLADKNLSWIKGQRGRVYRGLTSSAKKSRGLSNKGTGAEKIRPSKRAAYRRLVKKVRKNMYYQID